MRDLQIVNGGQTTASILYAKDRSRADLAGVHVQMKLSVVDPAQVEDLVPRISRYANTQTRLFRCPLRTWRTGSRRTMS